MCIAWVCPKARLSEHHHQTITITRAPSGTITVGTNSLPTTTPLQCPIWSRKGWHWVWSTPLPKTNQGGLTRAYERVVYRGVNLRVLMRQHQIQVKSKLMACLFEPNIARNVQILHEVM